MEIIGDQWDFGGPKSYHEYASSNFQRVWVKFCVLILFQLQVQVHADYDPDSIIYLEIPEVLSILQGNVVPIGSRYYHLKLQM